MVSSNKERIAIQGVMQRQAVVIPAPVNSNLALCVTPQVARVALVNAPLPRQHRCVDLQRTLGVTLRKRARAIHLRAPQIGLHRMVSSNALPSLQVSDSHQGKSCGSGLACASGVCTSPSCRYIRSDRILFHSYLNMAVQCQSIGGSMGLNASCPNRGDTSCQVSCQDPTKPNTCLLLGTLLVDGSPCGMFVSAVSPVYP